MAMITVALIGTGIGLAGSIGGAIQKNSTAKRQERNARRNADSARARIASLEASRQEIINPYEAITDLSGNLSNTYNNLGVATQAAEMQIEQTDIALANTLDTIRATGGGAGGATALAQAALQSKKGVSASIEQQESQNEALKAQGDLNNATARKQAAQQAKYQAGQDMFGGISSAGLNLASSGIGA